MKGDDLDHAVPEHTRKSKFRTCRENMPTWLSRIPDADSGTKERSSVGVSVGHVERIASRVVSVERSDVFDTKLKPKTSDDSRLQRRNIDTQIRLRRFSLPGFKAVQKLISACRARLAMADDVKSSLSGGHRHQFTTACPRPARAGPHIRSRPFPFSVGSATVQYEYDRAISYCAVLYVRTG